MTQLLIKRSPVFVIIALLFATMFAFAADIYLSIQKEKQIPQGQETASVAWQYGQLLAEFHRFSHQLDRAILLQAKPEEINALQLSRSLLIERLHAARSVSAGNNGELSHNSSPFVEIESLGKDSGFLAKESAEKFSTADLTALRNKVEILQDRITTLSIAATRLSAEAAVQSRVLANRLENSVLVLCGLLILLGIIVMVALFHASWNQSHVEKNYRQHLKQTEKTLSGHSVISMQQAHLLEDAQERVRLPLSGLRDLLTQSANEKTLGMLDKLQAAIDDSLDFALLNLGRLRAKNGETNLQNLLDDVVRQARKFANEKSVALLFDPMDPLPDSCETDETKVRKILSRLIHHAIDRSINKRVNIHVYSTSSHGGRLFIDITDSGPGLSGAELNQDIRHRKNNGRPTEDISLPLAKGLARLVGGNVTAINKPNEGCIFTVDIPIHRKPVSSQLQSSAEKQSVG